MSQPPLQIKSTITSGGNLELSLQPMDMPEPGPDQVVVRVEASPLNPSDLGLLLGRDLGMWVLAAGPVTLCTVAAYAATGRALSRAGG